MVSVEDAQSRRDRAQAELDDSIKHGRSDVAYRRQAVEEAQATLDEALATRAAAEKKKAADAAHRAGTFRGTVVEVIDSAAVRVSIDGGSPSYARLSSTVTVVQVDDLVELVKTGGVWQITNVLTKHPAPVVDSAGQALPPKPSTTVPVPGAPTSSSVPSFSSITPASLSDTNLWVSASAPSSYDPAYINRIRNALNALLDLVHTYSSSPGRWSLVLAQIPSIRSDLTALQNAQNSGVNAINGLRSGLSSAGSAITSSNDYTEDVGEAAAKSSEGVTNAVAEAGVVSKVPRWSVEKVDPIKGATWQENRLWVDKYLKWRLRQLGVGIRATLVDYTNYLKIAAPAGIGSSPSTDVDGKPWNVGAGIVQDSDDWAEQGYLTLRSEIGRVRTHVGLPAFAWPTGLTFAWSAGATSESSLPGLRRSYDSFKTAISALGTAMSEIAREINTRPDL